MEKEKKFAVWVSCFGDNRPYIIKAISREQALNKAMIWCRKVSYIPGLIHVLKIMEIK